MLVKFNNAGGLYTKSPIQTEPAQVKVKELPKEANNHVHRNLFRQDSLQLPKLSNPSRRCSARLDLGYFGGISGELSRWIVRWDLGQPFYRASETVLKQLRPCAQSGACGGGFVNERIHPAIWVADPKRQKPFLAHT